MTVRLSLPSSSSRSSLARSWRRRPASTTAARAQPLPFGLEHRLSASFPPPPTVHPEAAPGPPAAGQPAMLSAARRCGGAAAAAAGARGNARRAPAAAARDFASEAPPSGQQASPFSVLEQLGRETTLSKAQEAAQKVGEVASSGSPAPLLQELQGLAQANAEALGRTAVPICSAVLILSRSPGAPLSEAQQEKLAEALPAPMMDMLNDLVKVVPEDPVVEQLKRIGDKLDTLEAKLAAAAPPEPVNPLRLPNFAFAWLDLISNRMFMPKLLNRKGPPTSRLMFQRLVVQLLCAARPSPAASPASPEQPPAACLARAPGGRGGAQGV
ncbi:unnamed protein product, partial [Prorocentrum cordatum]